MNDRSLDHLELQLRLMARSEAPDLEAVITCYLAAELAGCKPPERLQLLEKLSGRFVDPAPPETAAPQAGGSAGQKELTQLVLQFLGQSPTLGTCDSELVENFARSLDLLFDSLNEIISVINVRLLGESKELASIRKVIGKNPENGSDMSSVKEYLDQIQRAFLAAHSSFQSAAETVVSELLADLDPVALEQGKRGSFRFGPLKKADLFDQYEERHARCRRWLESGQFQESLLREFEKNCRQILEGR